MTAGDCLQKRRGQANQAAIRAMAMVHEKKPGQRERTALTVEIKAEASGSVATCNHSKREVRSSSKFAASMEPYLWDTPDCKAIIKLLIGGRPPVRFDKVESRLYVYWTDGLQHWAIKPYGSAHGYLRFSLYECTDGGVMAAVEKSHKKAADKHLCAPDLFALLSQGATVPLPPEQRRQWKQELERQIFTKLRGAESDKEEIPLVMVESPDFMYSPAAKAFGVAYQNDVSEPIAERMLWFCINDGLQRGLQRRRAEKLFRLIQWFYNEWRMGARSGLPCVVEASDGYLANAIDSDAGTVRLLCETLERHGIIAKAHQYDSKKGSAHFGYLPGTGPNLRAPCHVPKTITGHNYLRPSSVLRKYRMHFGLIFPHEERVSRTLKL